MLLIDYIMQVHALVTLSLANGRPAFVSGDEDGTLRMYDGDDATLLRTGTATARVVALHAYDVDGAVRLVSAGADGTVQVRARGNAQD
jgi:WD40 repeat protein